MQIVQPNNGGGIIEWPNAEFDIIYVAGSVPLASLDEVSSCWVDLLACRDGISLNEQRLIVSALDLPFIVVHVLDSDHMSIFLVLAPNCAFIDPFSIVLTQSIKIEPEGAFPICSHTLWSLHIDWNLIISIGNIGEGGCWVAVTIKIIKFLLAEECFIIFMLEHLSIDCEPSVGVSNELVFIIDRGYDLEVKVWHVVAFSSSDGLYLPFVGSLTGDTDECLHLVAFPVDQKESVSVTFKSGNWADEREVSCSIWIITKCIFSRSNVESSHILSSISGKMLIVSVGSFGLHSLVAKSILSTCVFDPEMSVIVWEIIWIGKGCQFGDFESVLGHLY